MASEEAPLLPAALAWHTAGFSVIPIRGDGSKAPAVKWKDRWQHECADPDQITAWLRTYPGIGLVMGAVSGNAEMLELEGRFMADDGHLRLRKLCEDHGLADVWDRLANGYIELTPSGGLHFIYRVAGEVDGNRKLASRPARDDELTDDERTRGGAIRVLVETRGEGGQVVVAPSNGAVHNTGKPWKTLPTAQPGRVATLTAAERDALLAIATLLDELPPPPPPRDPIPFAKPAGPASTGGVAPGQDYNQRGSWEELLTTHGWRMVTNPKPAGRTYWTRPGKTNGISAVTGGAEHDLFWCWSSSVADIQTETSYSLFGLYTTLEHSGHYSAAASALRKQGYGSEPSRPVPPAATPTSTTSAVPRTDGNTARAPQPEPATESLLNSDDGNALALVEMFGDRIRHCPERGRWLTWDGHRWQWGTTGGGIVREHFKQLARALPEDTKPEIAHKVRALSAAGTTAALTQAATDARVVVGVDNLDAHPYELNTPGGIIDLRTGQTRPHQPAQLHTRLTGCAADFDADPKVWASFLAETFDGRPELLDYIQRLAGYSATGVVRDHILPFAYGPGRNGKGVFLEGVGGVLGDYATTAPSAFLMAKAFANHETEIARLAGARMVTCSEINEGDKFDEAKVKQLTGGDSLTARFMRQDHFTFRPSHKLWLMGNQRPVVASGGHSFWRRLRMVPFANIVPEAKVIEDLQGLLVRDHGPALLAWVVTGAVAYLSGGLAEPASVRAATADYAADQDSIGRFVDERCHRAAGNALVRIAAPIFRDAYDKWCAAEGETPATPKRLTMELRARFGTGDERSHGRRFHTGIALLADEDDPVEERYR